ncbi:MAG TPA: hypothetical protein VM782_03000 [Stellaceae bacterium]|nr:hypothetical protein [Stellaceae bacterium]
MSSAFEENYDRLAKTESATDTQPSLIIDKKLTFSTFEQRGSELVRWGEPRVD